MAEDVAQNILISADSSGATAAMAQLTQAIQSLSTSLGQSASAAAATSTATSAAMETVSRSTSSAHGAVYLFSRELLGTVGLSDVARHAMGAIADGFESFAVSIGTTTAALTPWLFALGGAIIVVEKLTKSHKAHVESLEAVSKKIEENVKVFDSYTAAGGRLDTAMQAVLSDEKAENAETVKSIANKTALALAADKAMQAQLEAVATQKVINNITGESVLAYGDQTQNLEKLNAKIHEETLSLEANAHGYATWQEYVKAATETAKAFQKSLRGGGDITDQEYEDDQNRMADQFEAAQDRLRTSQARTAVAAADAMAKIHDGQLKYQIELDKMAQKDNTWANGLRSVATSAFSSVEATSSRAFAKMIVEGQSATEAFKNFFRNMAEEIISDLIQMIEKQLIFNALVSAMSGGVNFPGVPAMGSMGAPGYAPGVGFGGGPSANFATGGDFLVSRPTNMTVGEGGEPERVTITPLSQSGDQSNDGGITVNVVNNFNGITDTRSLSQQVGLEISKAIRGRGQINFLRST